MHILFIIYLCIGILSLTGLVLLFCLKNKKASNIVMICTTVICVLTAMLNISSMPSNYIFQRTIAAIIPLCALLGCIIRFTSQEYNLLVKILVSVSLISTYCYLVF